MVENIQREDLDAIEVAISYQRLIEECNLTQENLSERVGKKRSTISNYLRLLRLPAEIQLGIREKKIGMGHARSLVNVEDPKIQIEAYYKIVDEDLSVRKIEEIVRSLHKKPEDPIEKSERKRKRHAEYLDLQQHLSKYFAANVQFRVNEKGKGKIVIPFDSGEDLERIIGIFDKLNG